MKDNCKKSLLVLRRIIAFFVVLLLFSCSKDEFQYVKDMSNLLEQGYARNDVMPYFTNNPLPEGKKELRVLAIGNSYTLDGVAYIQDILDSAYLDRQSYCVYSLTKGGKSLQYWAEESMTDDVFQLVLKAGNHVMYITKGSFVELLSQDWDAIVVQQVSSSSINYFTYNPYLRQLIETIKYTCTNPKVSLTWQMVHSYWTGYESSNNKPKGHERWRLNTEATRLMVMYDGIDIVIPTGTAIQNARNVKELQTSHDITRDGTHLAYGVGRYIASCTWVQTLFSKVYDIDIVGNNSVHPINKFELDATAMYEDSAVPVDNNNKSLCQKCAADACADWYNLSLSNN